MGGEIILNREVENILKINNNKQYEYFLKIVADFEEIWSLRDNDGWATLGMENNIFFPIWPKKEFANICINDEWENCYAESIDLYEFLEVWISGLKEDNIRITVMWHEGKGIDVGWDGLKKDIEYELQKY